MPTNNFITHGTLTLSNHGGMEIQLSDDGEAARLQYYGKPSRWQQVKYNRSGDPYVTHFGRKYSLNQFMKI